MEGIKTIFESAILQSDISFQKAKNESYMCSFILRKGEDSYKCTLFDDERKRSPYKKMKSLYNKGKLKKGTVLNVDAEMSMFEKNLVSDSVWKELLKENPAGDKYFPDGVNPTLGKFPQFRVKDWDYAIPVEYYRSNKEKTETEEEIKNNPANLAGFENGGAIC